MVCGRWHSSGLMMAHEAFPFVRGLSVPFLNAEMQTLIIWYLLSATVVTIIISKTLFRKIRKLTS